MFQVATKIVVRQRLIIWQLITLLVMCGVVSEVLRGWVMVRLLIVIPVLQGII
jgi:hypothetical protein